MKSRFRDLKVWQKAFALILEIYKITQHFPKEELFGLVSQMRRSSVSISSNIAEGTGKKSDNDFARFLHIAKGSCNELESQILISKALQFISKEQEQELLLKCEEILKMLSKLSSRLIEK